MNYKWRALWDGFKTGLDPRAWPGMIIMLWDWFRGTKPIYWLRTHTINRYHIVDIRSKYDDYKWGWVDRDHVMLLACFKILCDFVEKEMYGHVDWSWGPTCNARAEIMALYKYWTVERPAAERAVREAGEKSWEARKNGQSDDALAEARHALSEAFDIAEDAALMRLMAVRRYMWT